MLIMSWKKNLNPQGVVILRNDAIQRGTRAKFLGAIVDQHLNCKDHISMVSQNSFKSCGIISRIRNIFSIMEMLGTKSNLIIGDLSTPLYTATQSQLFVRYKAINTWNGLTGDLRSSSSLCNFNNKLRQLYLPLT